MLPEREASRGDPTLRRSPILKAGNLVIMGNFGSHRGNQVCKTLRAAGAKPALHKAQARSYGGRLTATAEPLDRSQPERRSDFADPGYGDRPISTVAQKRVVEI